MWRGYEKALGEYCLVCLREYEDRTSKTFPDRRKNILEIFQIYYDDTINREVYPPWFGNEDFHRSHRAALLAKDPEWYSRFGWKEKPNIEYVRPA